MIFDFHLQTTLQTHQQTFRLNVHCQSQAKRLAFIGASGSGKSLTLRILAGLWRAQHANIVIQNVCFANEHLYLSPQQRQIGFVFQDYALFPHLTIAQNIAFGQHKNWRNPTRKIDPLTHEWLERMQLTHLAEHYPHQISGGQKQRVALARACIVSPRCLLLDEPFSALDQTLRQSMRKEVFDLQKELDIPILLISHDVDDTKLLADEVWQMDNGELHSINAA